jgi:hypothetical protein
MGSSELRHFPVEPPGAPAGIRVVRLQSVGALSIGVGEINTKVNNFRPIIGIGE